ncbi:MAG: hypothetical protein V4600_10460 [Pseudomonadota bacterium]
MAQEEGKVGFIGILISGGSENGSVSDNEFDITGPGAGIVVEDHPSGNKNLKVDRNKIKHRLPESPPHRRSWFETYWVDVFSGSTVLVLAMLCAWLGLKS